MEVEEENLESKKFISKIKYHPELLREFLSKVSSKANEAKGQADSMKKEEKVEIKETPKVEEKKSFDVELSSFDAAKKLIIIKEFKNIFGLGLKEAKEMVEKLPASLKKNIKKEEAEELKTKLEALGCQVLLK